MPPVLSVGGIFGIEVYSHLSAYSQRQYSMTTAQSVHADRQVSASVALTIFEPRRTSQKARVNNAVREVILLGGNEYARGAGSK